MTPRRPFAFSALEAHLGWQGTQRVGRVLRASCASVNAWRAHGLTVDQADRLAIRVGVHPAEVWGVDWGADVDEVDYLDAA